MKGNIRSMAKKKLMMDNRFEIPKEAFHCLPVCVRWFMHKLGELINNKAYVWSSKCKILELANCTSILFCICRRGAIVVDNGVETPWQSYIENSCKMSIMYLV